MARRRDPRCQRAGGQANPVASAVRFTRTPRRAKIQWPLILAIAIAGCLPIFVLILWNSYESYRGARELDVAKPAGFELHEPNIAAPHRVEQEPGLLTEPMGDVVPLVPTASAVSLVTAESPSATPDFVAIGVAYGTEKRDWLQGAVEEFAKTDAGKRIQVQLIPMGSVESAQAIVNGDKRIHVWAPASRLYSEVFLRDWQARFRGNPIIREDTLALTPMVFVMWEERYKAFTIKAPEVTLRNIFYAMRAKTGWAAIAGKPEWGYFKFGHTHPMQSNSGLMTLILLGYDYYDKTSGLTVADIMDNRFQTYQTEFSRCIAGLSNSTGNMMQEMVHKGPQGFDALMVYESVAIDYIRRAEETWGRLYVVYPIVNIWNDNPYYILDTPWSDKAHQEAAGVFLDFLMSEPIQTRALGHGFRPGNPKVPVRFPGSPFVLYADRGLKIELTGLCEPPPADVVETLQQSWLRNTR